jgi:hypothetical protein
LWISERKRPQQDCVDDAEDGRVRGDADSEDCNRNGGKACIPPQSPKRVTEVLNEFVPVISALRSLFSFLAQSLAFALDGPQISELPVGFTLCCIQLPALLNEVIYFGLQVKLQFIFDIAFRIWTEQPRVAAPQRNP